MTKNSSKEIYEANIDDSNQNEHGLKQPFYRSLWFLLIVAGFSILAVILVLWQTGVVSLGLPGLEFSIDYDDIQYLDLDASVYFRGFVIGQVVEKSIVADSDYNRVKVVIERKYADLLSEGSIFRQFDVPTSEQGSKRAIEIKEYVSTYPRIQPGAVYLGADDAAEEYIQAAKMLGKDLADKYLYLGEIRVKTTISDGQINRVIVLETGTLIPQQLFFSNALPDQPAWNRTNTTTERRRLFTAEGTFSNPGDASWSKSMIVYETTSNILWTDHKFIETFEKDNFLRLVELEPEEKSDLLRELVICAANPEECFLTLDGCLTDISACIKQLSNLAKPLLDNLQQLIMPTNILPLQNIPIQISITMPGKILESNADNIRNDSAVWSTDGNMLNAGMVLSVSSREYKLIPIFILTLLLLAVISISVVFLLRKHLKRNHETNSDAEQILF